MNSFLAKRQSGFSMVETLVALIIMSFGLVALVRFQIGMVGYGGLIKAKTVATTLAQEKMEELRNQVLVSDARLNDTTTSPASGNLCGTGFAYDDISADGNVSNAAIGSNPDRIAKVNTNFLRCYKIVTVAATVTEPQHKTIETKMIWVDHSNETQTVSLNSIITWTDPADSAFVATTDINSSTLVTPSGGAVLGGDNSYTPGNIPGTPNGDGTSTHTPGDGTTELIDNTTGDVLLTVTSGNTLATVSGNVYVEGTNSSAETTANATYPVISDAGVCTRTISSPIDTIAAKYTYYDYTCYVGSTWYGNIGLVRTDNPNSNARVCLGDPSASDTVLSTIRTYRGYETRTDANNNLVVDGNGDPVYFPVGMPDNTVLTGHHFLVTTITGNPSDSDCVTPLSSSPQQFGSNPDDFYCLTNSCPGGVTNATLTVSGTYTSGHVNSIQVTNGGLCTMTSGTYACNIIYVAGTSWSGSITVNPATGYEVCSTNPLPFSGLTSDSTGNTLTTAATGTCGGGGGATTHEVEGYVTISSGPPAAKTTSLVGLTLTASPSTGASCTYSYTDGNLTYAEIECTVPTGFSGTITLSGFDSRDNNTNVLDYSSSPVTGDLSNQDIVIAK